MSEPSTQASIDRIEARLDRIEGALERLTGVLDQLEPNVAIAFDVVDEESRRAQARGVDIDARLVMAGELVEKLTAPEKLESLGRMVERLEGLEFSAGLAAGAEDHVAMAFDIVDEQVRELQAHGVDVDQRLRLAGRLLEVASDPGRLESLTRVVEKVEQLEPTIDLAAGFENHVAIAFDTFDEVTRELKQRGIDLDARMQATQALVEQATAPEKLAVLQRMVERLEKLEPMVELAAGFEDHVAMAFDTLDEETRRLKQRGIDVDQRLQALAAFTEEATDPEKIEALRRMLEKIEELEPMVELAAGFEDHVAMAFDIVDEEARRMGAAGIDVDARSRALVAFAEDATDPEKLEALARMLAKIERLEPFVELSAKVVDNIAIAFDIFDEETGRLAAEGVDFGQAVANGIILFETLAHWVTSPAFQRLLDSGLIDPTGLGKATELSETLLRQLHAEPEQAGIWKAMGAMSDPDMQRFVGFTLALGRSVGTLLGKPSSCMIAEAK